MNPDTERILEYLDNDDYDGARNYAERHACESDVCAEYREIQIAGSSCWYAFGSYRLYGGMKIS